MSDETKTPAVEKSYIEQRIDELVAAGSAKRGLGPIPDELVAERPAKLPGGLLAQVLEDRDRDW